MRFKTTKSWSRIERLETALKWHETSNLFYTPKQKNVPNWLRTLLQTTDTAGQLWKKLNVTAGILGSYW